MMELNKDLNTSEYKTDRELNDVLANLSIEKDNLVSEGRYLEAEHIKNKINELKMNMTGMKKKDLNYQQSQEMQNLEDNFNQELNQLDDKWENFFLNFNDRVKKIDDANSIRHRAEMEDLHALLDMKLPKQPKFSKEYLVLKQSEYNLVKQERYTEAHQIKTKCDEMERVETDKHIKERNEKFKIKTDQLVHKQSLERNALKQKLDTEYEMMKKQKDEETQKLVHKYKNRKMDLELQHNQERNLSENESLLKAKTSANALSMSHRNVSKISPSKYKYFTSEYKLKELSKTLKKNIDESELRYISSKASPQLKRDELIASNSDFNKAEEAKEKSPDFSPIKNYAASYNQGDKAESAKIDDYEDENDFQN